MLLLAVCSAAAAAAGVLLSSLMMAPNVNGKVVVVIGDGEIGDWAMGEKIISRLICAGEAEKIYG